MSRWKSFNVLHLIPLACLLCSVRAFAQFEVAPDHFDSSDSQPVRSAVKTKTTAATGKATPGAVRNERTSAATNARKQSNRHHAKSAVRLPRTRETANHVSAAKPAVVRRGSADAVSTVALKPVESSPSVRHRE